MGHDPTRQQPEHPALPGRDAGSTPPLAAGIDAFTGRIGRAVSWLVVAAVLVSAGNAIVRKLFDTSSNAWLDIQWWLFGALVLFAAPWTLAANEHIRIDVLSSRFAPRTRSLIDVIGHALFLIPVAAVVLYTSWDFFWRSYAQNEQAVNAGGLPQWPAKFLIPAGFALLLLQGVSELAKALARHRAANAAAPPPSASG